MRRRFIIPDPPEEAIQVKLKDLEAEYLQRIHQDWTTWRRIPESETHPHRPNHDELWRRIRLLRVTLRYGWTFANRTDRAWLEERFQPPAPEPTGQWVQPSLWNTAA